MLCDEEEDSPKVCYSVKAQTVFDELSNYFFKVFFKRKKYDCFQFIYLASQFCEDFFLVCTKQVLDMFDR